MLNEFAIGGGEECGEWMCSVSAVFCALSEMHSCDVDGSQLVTRNDDREDVIRERLTAYELQTRPVVEYYERKGRLVPVNADLPVDEVSEQVFREIESHSPAAAGRN